MPDERHLRRATPADLPGLMALEEACYDPARRASRKSLRTSLTSTRQSVWVLGDPIHASLILWHHPRCTRIYGVATHPDQRGTGIGAAMLAHAATFGPRITLEADAADERLLRWYETHGFRRVVHKPDFYEAGRHAWRMERP